MVLIKDNEKEKYCEERRQKIKEEYPFPKMISFENKTKYHGMVIIKDIEFSTKCEHHLVAIKGKCHIGYIPNLSLLGLSQLARVVEYYCNPTTAITQEEVNQKITEFIQTEAEPLGVIVVMEASHDCMNVRGVRQRNAITITSQIKGAFENEKARNEFLQLIARKNEI